jgi:hypothetical protein
MCWSILLLNSDYSIVHLLVKYSKITQNARYILQQKCDKSHVHGRRDSHSFVTGVCELFMRLKIVRHFQSKERLGKIRVLRHGV